MTTPTFDLVVVGSGGGALETDLSAYLLKPCSASWQDGIIALEAGSGQGALKELLLRDPLLFSTESAPSARVYTPSEIYSFIQCFLITHPHLDHVTSLILSAGSLGGGRKKIHASKRTLDGLTMAFNGVIWPKLATWNEDETAFKLIYSELPETPKFHAVFPQVSVQTHPLSHGTNNQSSAFFIRHEVTEQEILFLGDVEPDSIAEEPRTVKVWQTAAPKIPHKLSTIFIECSWPSGRDDSLLYGHLNPEHLTDELAVLATEVVKLKHGGSQSTASSRPHRKRKKTNPITADDLRGALDGVRVFVIHCKHDVDSVEPIRTLIVEQVRALVEARGLGAEILAAEPGMSIQI